MATPATIWNHPTQPLASPHTAAAASASPGSSAANNGSTISSNDFLTLLVTEMKNQDPTANNDPNAYINQLVQVNSLQQLIEINQTLSGKTGTSATGGVQTNPSTAVSSSPPANAAFDSTPSSPRAGHPGNTAGNLSVPDAVPAAQRVAHALSQRAHLG